MTAMTTIVCSAKRALTRLTLLALVPALALAGGPIGVSFADDTGSGNSNTPPPCVAPKPTTPGVHVPTGADSGTFTYQCDGPHAGLWTNDYYSYDPTSGQRTALYTVTYTYNPLTGMWDYNSWDYSAAKNIYINDTLSTKTPPANATTVGGPKAANGTGSSSDDDSDNSGGSGNGALDKQSTGTNDGEQSEGSLSPTGSSSIDQQGNFNTTLNNNTGAVMSNVIIVGSASGNASVIGNTSAGSAATGTANVISNIVNMLQSSSTLDDPNLVTFTANINGDVNGDLLLDPNHIGTVTSADGSINNNVTVNSSTDTTIDNNINLNAKTGDAAVSNNTKAGDAASGNANAVANIVNILNSAVSAGKSFVGVININGNLNGDILLPPNFIDTLLASNVPRYQVTTSINNDVSVSSVNNASINNNVNASAKSGDAAVSNNTTGGNATSGSALTNLTIFNLTGTSVVASNNILVFVNVLGSWYGMILNAPAGTTAASLGGGVSSNTSINNNASLVNTNNQTINNHINVGAESGDATVDSNTQAGSARSGDASASVNLLNMINDRLSLNGWFGLLFINVFGSWNGSFGINTAAGDPALAAATSSSTPSSAPQTFGFVPKQPPAQQHPQSASSTTGWGSGSASGNSGDGVVLAAQTIQHQDPKATVPVASTPTHMQRTFNALLLPAVGGVIALALFLAGQRRQHHSHVVTTGGRNTSGKL